ncbi:MAG: DUF3108 domain-containing protein [Calditrichia bacterium]
MNKFLFHIKMNSKENFLSITFALFLLASAFWISSGWAAGEDLMSPDSVNIDSAATSASDTVNTRKLDRVVSNSAFKVGEKLSFKVRYGFIKAGEASMEVKDIVPLGNREAYKIVSTARSTGTFDIFFKVRDLVESYIDTKGLYSLKFNKKLREGSYKFDLLVDYKQDSGKAQVNMIRFHDGDEPLKVKEKKEFEIDTPPYVLDILASFYYVRTQKLRVGMPLYIMNHDNKKIYDLKVLVQKRETIKVDAGKFKCIVVQPVLRGESIFKQKGKLWVWLTDDQYKIPVQMKSAVLVGSITTELTGIEGVPLPLPSQVKK